MALYVSYWTSSTMKMDEFNKKQGHGPKCRRAPSNDVHKSDGQLSMRLPYWIHFCLAAHTNGQRMQRIVAIRDLCMRRRHCEPFHKPLIYGRINLATIWFLKHVLGCWICPIPNQMATASSYFMWLPDLYTQSCHVSVAGSQGYGLTNSLHHWMYLMEKKLF